MKNLTHDRILSECFLWVWNTYPETRFTMFHVRNESRPEGVKRILYEFAKFASLFLSDHTIDSFCKFWQKKHIVELSKAKAIGVVPGVLDLIWYWNGTVYAFDVKVDKDRLSDHQLTFIQAIEKQGGKCFEIRSLEQFQNEVTLILRS